MIRMGRSSKPEQSNETAQNYQEQQPLHTSAGSSNPTYPFTSDSIPTSTRAISESESMARDIKEGRLSGYVGNGTTLTGETNFQAMLRIDGHLTGRVSSETGTLIVGGSGQVDANIAVAAAVINGTVNGDIVATEKLQLGRTARVVGNIQSPRLVLEDGAVLEGNCTMLKAKESFDKRHSELQINQTHHQDYGYSSETQAVPTLDEETASAAAS